MNKKHHYDLLEAMEIIERLKAENKLLHERHSLDNKALEKAREMNDLTISVFFQDGDEPFIWQINGKITVNSLVEIERDIHEYSETMFDKGDGSYVFSVTREEGQCEFPPYWDLSFIEFEPYEMAGDMTDPIGHPME